jgi:hypothetical protein
VEKGWIKQWRREKESLIFKMPPLYYKVWRYLLMEANHEERVIPVDGKPFKVLPGQKLTSVPKIAEANAYWENNKWVVPSNSTVRRVLEFLAENTMIAWQAWTGKYSLVTVCNWETYQGHATAAWTGDEQAANINKNIYTSEHFSVHEKQHTAYKEAYPNLDLMGEYKAMAAWLESNPKKRKTPRGYPRFINNWLSKAHKEQKGSPDWRDKLKPL